MSINVINLPYVTINKHRIYVGTKEISHVNTRRKNELVYSHSIIVAYSIIQCNIKYTT